MQFSQEGKVRIEQLCNHILRDKRFAQENPMRIKDELSWLDRQLQLAEAELFKDDRAWCEDKRKILKDAQAAPRGFLGGTARTTF